MEAWKKVWRKGVAPLLSDEGLIALEKGLREDDKRLIQGATTQPPPLMTVQDWPVEGCCGISYCGWKGDGLDTVGELEEFFARMCWSIDERLGEPGGCRHFVSWFDETPRATMRPLLLAEVKREINRRKEK